MEIIVAENAGACYGVNRSLKIVQEAAMCGKKVATLGELIHNPIVISELTENYDIRSVHSVEAAEELDVDILIIRSHGVSLRAIQDAESKNIEIIDATCPYVKNVQTTASVMAGLYPAVLIVGKTGHPEVESVSSYIKDQDTNCFIAETKEEIDEILKDLKTLNDKIGVVSQTTQSAEVFDKIVEYLSENDLSLEVENTICVATKKRQQAAIDLSTRVDAMLVIGGKNSSNTNHLADLCRKNCKKTFHIETIEQLDKVDLSSIEILGVTAGASTPKSQIDSIISQLQ